MNVANRASAELYRNSWGRLAGLAPGERTLVLDYVRSLGLCPTREMRDAADRKDFCFYSHRVADFDLQLARTLDDLLGPTADDEEELPF